MTADEILNLKGASLFPGDATEIKRRFRELSLKWHPDHSSDVRAQDVLEHLVRQRDAALHGPKLERAVFALDSGKSFSFEYLSKRRWEAGEIYVTASAVVYRVEPAQRDLAHLAGQHVWKFPTDKFRDEMTRFLPNHVRTVETSTLGTLMIYRRNPDQVLMADLLDRIEGPVPVPHAMWFVSALMNICSYLYITEQTHFGLSPEVLLVSPPMHSVALTGPCLYLARHPDRPRAVPSAVLSRYPSLRDKKAAVPHFVADTTEVRSIAMSALGAHDIHQLRSNPDIPPGFKSWLLSAPDRNSVKDYGHWEDKRGTRRFTPYDLTAQQVYDLG